MIAKIASLIILTKFGFMISARVSHHLAKRIPYSGIILINL